MTRRYHDSRTAVQESPQSPETGAEDHPSVPRPGQVWLGNWCGKRQRTGHGGQCKRGRRRRGQPLGVSSMCDNCHTWTNYQLVMGGDNVVIIGAIARLSVVRLVSETDSSPGPAPKPEVQSGTLGCVQKPAKSDAVAHRPAGNPGGVTMSTQEKNTEATFKWASHGLEERKTRRGRLPGRDG
jgi:hypothetical protein